MKPSDPGRTFVVTGVCCASEENVLRKSLDRNVGDGAYKFSPVTSELRVTRAVSRETIVQAVQSAGFGVRERVRVEEKEPFFTRHRRTLEIAVAVVLGVVGSTLLESGARIPGRGLLAAAMAFGGWEIAVKAFKALRQGALDTNVLMMIAMAGAIGVNKWEEAVAVIVLFSFSLVLESYASARTRRAVQSLMALSPAEAIVIRNGKDATIKAEEVKVGDIVTIRPGMRIPVDGIVLEGESTVSEAMLTGEPLPAEKFAGSEVYAGCLNERGSLRIRVSRAFEETRLSHIIHLVEEAQYQKPPIQTTMDRFAARYTWIVLLGAIAVAVVPPLVYAEPFRIWFYRALIMLVISCPCALVISTPVTFVSALTAAARSGVLVKGGKHFETLARLRSIAFDKTGTLTEGRPRITDLVPLNGMTPKELLALVAAIEQHSEHQLGSAIVREAALWGIEQAPMSIDRFEALPGRGIASVVDGKEFFLGNCGLAGEMGFDTPELVETVKQFEAAGKSTLSIGRPGEALGVIAFRDTLRRESRPLVQSLRSQGMKDLVMLSGDAEESAKVIAQDIGLEDWRGSLLPGDKVEAIKELRTQHGLVAMVGDGINDTPALAAASVGIAMGGNGTDAALETADVVLMSDNLLLLPPLFTLSRKTMKIVRQNIVFALAIKAMFLLLSVAGIATLWLALLADDGAALLVILNGMRALRRLQIPVGAPAIHASELSSRNRAGNKST